MKISLELREKEKKAKLEVEWRTTKHTFAFLVRIIIIELAVHPEVKYFITTVEVEIKIIVQTVDSDSNDCLDINEFTKLIDAINETGEEVKRQFYFFDKNGDGQISKKELQKSLQELNANISKCQMKRMIREADLDGDGTISFEEFQKILISQGWEPERLENFRLTGIK